MGLGRLNPGCGCACSDPPPPPNDPCREAGFSMLPISVSLTCPSYDLGQGLGILSEPGPMFVANPGSVTYMWPNYLDPLFSCLVGAISQAGPISTNLLDVGYWKIFDNGTCFFALTNISDWTPNTFNLGFPPILFRATAAIGRDLFTNRLEFQFQLSAAAVITTGIRVTGPPGTCDWSAGDVGQIGNNWVRDANFGLVEIGAPPWRPFCYRRTRLIAGPIVGGWGLSGVNNPTWSVGFLTMEMFSSFRIFLDDPLYGDMRSFQMWQPDPAPFDFGIFDGVSGSIVLGIA